MKRFSKVVRHPHKLTQLSAGLKTKADKKKKKENALFCEEKRITQESITRTSYKEQNKAELRSLHLAWCELEKAQDNVETLMNVLEVLLNTCVNPCACVYDSGNPNGDIRAYLCDKNLTCDLLIALSSHWDKALAMMSLTDVQRRVLRLCKPENGIVSLELLQLSGWTSELGEEEVSSHHLSVLMPWLVDQDNLTARILCDDWERLANGVHGEILFALSHPDSLRSWLDTMLVLDEVKSEFFLKSLIDKDVGTNIVTDNVAPVMSLAFYQVFTLKIDYRVDQFLYFLMKGMSTLRINCLLELEMMIDVKAKYYYHNNEGIENVSILKSLSKYLRKDQMIDLWSGRFTNEVWYSIIERMDHYALDDAERRHFLSLMLRQCSYLKCDEEAIEWYVDHSAKAFKEVKPKFYQKLENLLYDEFCNGVSLTKWKRLMHLVQIVCSSNMSPQSSLDDLFRLLDRESAEDLFIQNLSTKAWQHLDRYLRSENKGEIMIKGIDRLFIYRKDLLSIVMQGLGCSPKITLEMLSMLGLLPKHKLKDLFEWLDYHPVYELSASSIEQRCTMLRHLAIEYRFIDMPKKLLQIVDEGKDVSCLRKEVLAKETDQLKTAEIRILFTAMTEYLTEIFGGEDVTAHSFVMINTSSSNRRGGKRALQKHKELGEASRLFHPSNIHWLQQPKSFWRPGVWIKGVYEETELEGIGEVVIKTESRFDEILKMGSYVNSCLSIGGCNQHSAIANALDANKRVLYLHDASGKFIARQLLAITKDRKLACFSVYHASHKYNKKVIGDYFACIDRSFSVELGVMIQEKDEYEVEKVVCNDWYDDGIWVPTLEEEAS